MKPDALPCAVYTRKSSEEGLEQGFNSLDAQREACAAYILSQKAMGWTPVADAYDDGGFSGGNVERPALKRLLADIAAHRVRVVVVYKVDRLTRSLADFAKMVELFDAHGVSFVSVTQQFNTTTSMGRLTLNVLLSFAQFEREVTGERIRDKIAASKRKGMWMGGIPPVGYLAKDRTLVLDEPNAERIREMYRLYLELGCVRRLKDEVARRAWVTPLRNSKRSGGGGGRPFSRGHLYRLLSNPVYIGRILHRDLAYPGNHPAAIDEELWQAVQDLLKANQQGRKTRTHAAQPSLLAGLAFDEKGLRLTPSHAKKGNRRYRYYIGETLEDQPLRIPATELEGLVIDALIAWLSDQSRILAALGKRDAHAVRASLQRARELAVQIKLNPRGNLASCLNRVDVSSDKVSISVKLDGLETQGGSEWADGEVVLIEVPARLRRCGMATRLVVDAPGASKRRAADPILIALIARAHEWLSRLTSGRSDSIAAIANDEEVSRGYVTRLIHLALMAPDIVQRIARGEHPPELSAAKLMRLMPLPHDWGEQKKLLGFD
jgi:site-specific DNA recombinase